MDLWLSRSRYHKQVLLAHVTYAVRNDHKKRISDVIETDRPLSREEAFVNFRAFGLSQ